ncbi:hypothetical protein ACHAXT_001065 [Thalassiosira profunda]
MLARGGQAHLRAGAGASSLGDIQSLQAGRRLIVFKHTEALTLVSISDREDGNHHEAWLRLQLEYVYAQVIFTLTDQVQAIFKRSPGFDLRSMMGPNVDGSIRNLLDRFDPIDLDENYGDTSDLGHGAGCGSLLTAGVECIHPIPPEIRDAASRMLVRACGGGKGQNRNSADDLYAILMVGTRLLTIVQPSNVASQLHTSDLNLILTFRDGPAVQAEQAVKESNLGEAPLLTALRVALSNEQQEEMMSSYLQLASAVHFVFRCDIYVGSGEPSGGIGADATGSMLTQCFGPPLSFPFTDASSKAHVWDTYARLSLRLRLGSASVETTMDALDAIDDTHAQDQYGIDSRGVSRECPMQCLLEAPPRVHSVTYVQEDNEWLFIGLNGKFFELYATLPATIAPKKGTAYCARLVRRLMNDERILFLSNPLTWTSQVNTTERT